MARGSSRRGKAPQPEEEYDEPMDDIGEDSSGEGIMTALLILSFGFIFFGIVLAWWTLHKNFDTPFLGVVQKAPAETVESKAKKDWAKEQGEAGEEYADEDEEEDEEEEPSEEEEEE